MAPTPTPPLLIPIRTPPPDHRHRPPHLHHLRLPIPPTPTPMPRMRMMRMMVMMPSAPPPGMRPSRLPRPAPRRRSLAAHAVVPRAAARVRRRVGRRPEVAARAEDPEEQEQAGDGADDDAGDGAAGEGLGAGGVVVVGRGGGGAAVGDDDLAPAEEEGGCFGGGAAEERGGAEGDGCHGGGCGSCLLGVVWSTRQTVAFDNDGWFVRRVEPGRSSWTRHEGRSQFYKSLVCVAVGNVSDAMIHDGGVEWCPKGLARGLTGPTGASRGDLLKDTCCLCVVDPHTSQPHWSGHLFNRFWNLGGQCRQERRISPFPPDKPGRTSSTATHREWWSVWLRPAPLPKPTVKTEFGDAA